MKTEWNTIRHWAWRLLRIAVVLAVIVGGVYWVQFAPVFVKQHQVERGEIVAEVMGAGTLEAHIKATVSSKISGRIAKVLVGENKGVRNRFWFGCHVYGFVWACFGVTRLQNQRCYLSVTPTYPHCCATWAWHSATHPTAL